MASMTLAESGMLTVNSQDNIPSGITLSNGVKILSGNGSPDGVISAPAGSLFLRKNSENTPAHDHLYVNINGELSWRRVVLV